jgi:hypothetical protein
VYQPAPAPSNNFGIEDTYLYFDSFAKETSSDLLSGELKFNINTLNNSQPIDKCVQVQVGNFFFPMVTSSNGPDFYFFRRVYMQITSFPNTQAVLAPNNSSYHFEFDVELVGSIAVKLVPVKESFYFRQPLTTLTEFNVSFMVPSGRGGSFKRITLPQDVLVIKAIPGSNPARFEILAGGDISSFVNTLPTVYPNTPTIPIAVYMSGFTSTDPDLNSQINNPNGIFVTGFPTDKYTFEVGGINLAALDPAQTYNFQCYVGKNRIAMPVRFTCVKNVTTNYLQASHE